MEQRIVELEIRIAYQEKTIRDLDEMVTKYAARLDAMGRELAELRARMDATGAASEAPEIVDEPPPHY
ncbi:MAG: SlyX family protein [Nannocystaceae bacterium]|jgi:SlyX protein